MIYNEYKELVKKMDKNENITVEEKNITIETLKKAYGVCLTCPTNDGLPHGECWSCDD